MRKMNWTYWLVAAAIVVVGGAALVFAETMTIKVEQRDGEQVEVDLDGEVHLIRLEDLVDGEEREFAAGDHTVRIRRAGDELQASLDGEEVASHGLGSFGSGNMMWVTKGGDSEGVHLHAGPAGARRVIVMKDGEEGEGEMKTYTVRLHTDEDCEGCEDCEGVAEIDIEQIEELIETGDIESLEGLDQHKVMVFKSEESRGAPVIIKKIRALGGDVVRYRCEETGSELIVKKEDAVSDTYICPATGCVMERVEEPEMKVIRIEHEVHSEEGGDQE